MEMEDSEGMCWYRMESIIGSLIYVTSKYRDMNNHFKGLHLTMDSWIPYRDKYGWQLWGEGLNMSKLDGKWEDMKEVNKPNLVIGVPRLRGYLLAPGRLKK